MKYCRLSIKENSFISENIINLISNNYPIPVTEINSEDCFFLGGPANYLNFLDEIKKVNGNYINIDKGYFSTSPKVSSHFRLTYNDLQMRKCIEVDDNRLKKFNIELSPWNKSGSYIMILAPNANPLKFYENCDIINWITTVKKELLKLTDRKIFVRYKDNKKIRSYDPLKKYFNDCYCIITLQSLGSVEATINGIPCINLAPSCLQGLHNMTLNNIESLTYPDNRYEWLKTLSYCQFTYDEFKNGSAMHILEKYQKGN
mgnify:CR=1 FL=1